MVEVSVNVTSVVSCPLLNCGWVLAFFPSLTPEKCRWMMRACWEGRGLSGFVVSSSVSLGANTYFLWVCWGVKNLCPCAPNRANRRKQKSLVLQGAFSGCSPRSPVMTVLSAPNQDHVLDLSFTRSSRVWVLLNFVSSLVITARSYLEAWTVALRWTKYTGCLPPLCIGMKVVCKIK